MKGKDKQQIAWDKLFQEIEVRMRGLSSSERQSAYVTLGDNFREALLDIEMQREEVEYGQHLEGIYGMNFGEPLHNSGPGCKFGR